MFTQGELDELEGQLSLFEMVGTLPDGTKSGQRFPEEAGKSTGDNVQKMAEQMQASDTGINCEQMRELSQGSVEPRKRASEVSEKGRTAGISAGIAGTAEPARYTWNENQRKAIESIDRVAAVTAGPGTGKTGTLAAHILYLLETRRVKPSCITAVTFTNQADRKSVV